MSELQRLICSVKYHPALKGRHTKFLSCVIQCLKDILQFNCQLADVCVQYSHLKLSFKR